MHEGIAVKSGIIGLEVGCVCDAVCSGEVLGGAMESVGEVGVVPVVAAARVAVVPGLVAYVGELLGVVDESVMVYLVCPGCVRGDDTDANGVPREEVLGDGVVGGFFNHGSVDGLVEDVVADEVVPGGVDSEEDAAGIIGEGVALNRVVLGAVSCFDAIAALCEVVLGDGVIAG